MKNNLLHRYPYITILGIILLLGAGLFAYSQFDPSRCRFFPECLFYKITGLRCPGCGSQRALHAILNGNISEALRYNIFILFAIPIIAYYAIIEFFRNRFPRLYLTSISPIAIISIFLVTLCWWIIRNVIGI